jgi:hypothetical protein
MWKECGNEDELPGARLHRIVDENTQHTEIIDKFSPVIP